MTPRELALVQLDRDLLAKLIADMGWVSWGKAGNDSHWICIDGTARVSAKELETFKRLLVPFFAEQIRNEELAHEKWLDDRVIEALSDNTEARERLSYLARHGDRSAFERLRAHPELDRLIGVRKPRKVTA